jgi:hypothetical protein
VPPVPARPTSWRTFSRAHWGAIAGADFFTTEVWTWRGLMTYYTVFVIDLASRRVHVLGSIPHPGELFMRQVGRTLTVATDSESRAPRLLICDRDTKWNGEVRRLLADGGIRVMLHLGRPRMRMRTRSGSCGPLNRNASTGCCRSASAISDES